MIESSCKKIKNHQTYVMCKEEEKKYVCMSAWVWESARDRTKEKNKKKKKKIWKTYEKKNNKKKIINHLKTSFYCESSNDFIEKKERKKSKQNGVFHFLYTCFYRILAFVFIGHHLFVPGGRDPVLIWKFQFTTASSRKKTIPGTLMMYFKWGATKIVVSSNFCHPRRCKQRHTLNLSLSLSWNSEIKTLLSVVPLYKKSVVSFIFHFLYLFRIFNK